MNCNLSLTLFDHGGAITGRYFDYPSILSPSVRPSQRGSNDVFIPLACQEINTVPTIFAYY